MITFIGGLALATALWSGVQAINSEARTSYDAAASTLGEGQFDQLVPRSGNAIPIETYINLRRNGWLVSPVVEGRVNEVRIIGVDALTSPGGLPNLQLSEETPLQEFLGEDAIYANQETAAALEISIPVRISPNVAPGVAITDIAIAQEILARTDLTRLMVADTQSLARTELAEIAPELRLVPSQQSADLGELTESFHLNLTAFGFLSFAVGIFIVHSTIGLAFEQRRASFRTLRALGVSLRSLIVSVVVEILFLAGIGATIGIILGYFVAAALLPDVAATLRSLYGAEVTGTLQLRAEWWLSGYAIALIGTGAALTGKLWQIANMPILASAQSRAWVMAVGRVRVLQAIVALLLFGISVFLLGFGNGLIAGFAVLACLLLGAALILPITIEKCLGLLEGRVLGVIPQWFLADTRQQIPGLSLALMALLLAIAANIGVSTMVSSFRLTFVEFLDQRLAPELFVYIDDSSKSETVEAALVANADEVLLLYNRKGTARGMPIEIDGIRVGQTYRDNWRLLAAEENVWDKLASGEVILANEQFARRAELWVGDRVQFDGKDLKLGGVVGDYGNPLGQITLGEKLYRQLYPDDRAQRFGARTSDPETLKTSVQKATGLADSAFTNQADIKSFSLQVFERTFTVTAALNVLTLAVAGFAMF
ncbi:MAG: ABC transporter permease, partial [Pseudomonadota bacterium]